MMVDAKEKVLKEVWHALVDLAGAKVDRYEWGMGKKAQRLELEAEVSYLYDWIAWVEAELRGDEDIVMDRTEETTTTSNPGPLQQLAALEDRLGDAIDAVEVLRQTVGLREWRKR